MYDWRGKSPYTECISSKNEQNFLCNKAYSHYEWDWKWLWRLPKPQLVSPISHTKGSWWFTQWIMGQVMCQAFSEDLIIQQTMALTLSMAFVKTSVLPLFWRASILFVVMYKKIRDSNSSFTVKSSRVLINMRSWLISVWSMLLFNDHKK